MPFGGRVVRDPKTSEGQDARTAERVGTVSKTGSERTAWVSGQDALMLHANGWLHSQLVCSDRDRGDHYWQQEAFWWGLQRMADYDVDMTYDLACTDPTCQPRPFESNLYLRGRGGRTADVVAVSPSSGELVAVDVPRALVPQARVNIGMGLMSDQCREYSVHVKWVSKQPFTGVPATAAVHTDCVTGDIIGIVDGSFTGGSGYRKGAVKAELGVEPAMAGRHVRITLTLGPLQPALAAGLQAVRSAAVSPASSQPSRSRYGAVGTRFASATSRSCRC